MKRFHGDLTNLADQNVVREVQARVPPSMRSAVPIVLKIVQDEREARWKDQFGTFSRYGRR